MHRLPAGLTYSALVAALSLGCLTLLGGLGTRGGRGPEPLAHTASALCLLWSVLAYGIGRWSNGQMRSREDLLSVLQIGSLVMGLLAVIVLLFAATIEVFIRTVYFDYELPQSVVIWRTGVLDLALITLGAVLHWRRTGHGNLLTAAFWLVVLAGLWAAFNIPAARHVGVAGAGYQLPSVWGSVFVLAAALAIGGFTLVQGILADRRRCAAWPNSLSDLVTPLPAWPGFDLSVGIVGAVILMVGCAHVVLPWTAGGSFVAGASLLALAHWRWNENLADEGLALITLGVVSLCMVGFDRAIWPNLASILNRAVVGLAVMAWFWPWLARVWTQQLDNGRAWTTAGRLIRTLRRVGFLTACTGVLLSLQLMLWPTYHWVLDPDMSRGRWIGAFAANGLLLLAILSAMRGTRRTTLGWLALLTAGSMIGFCLVRAPGSLMAAWIVLHWPVALAGGAGLCLLVAWGISRSPTWKALQESLVYTGVLVAPMAAIAGVTLSDAAILGHVPLWVPAGTFGVLAGVYAIAALHPGPSTFLTVTVLCAVMALWNGRGASGRSLMPPPYFYALMSGLCLTLIAVAYQNRGGRRTLWTLKWMGAGLALVSLVAGLLAHR